MKYSDICAIDSQGRVVIPSKIRKHLNIETGTSLELELYLALFVLLIQQSVQSVIYIFPHSMF